MGLTIATFVPDGIVIASDSLAEIRHQDDGFFQSEIEKLLVVDDKYVLAIEGNGFYEGIPVSSYLLRLLYKPLGCSSVLDVAKKILQVLAELMPNESLMTYIAGYDYNGDQAKPVVALIHDNHIDCINQAPDGTAVYNFHSIGRTHWVNKLLMQTQGVAGEEKVEFQGFDIDFSKYSIAYAKEFSDNLITISERMDRYSQLKPMVGGKHQVAVIRPFKSIQISTF